MSETELTLGQYLRTERERRGITIEQVASATKITVKYLHLLEADQFAELPAKPFIRGFVTSYSRFIGLDSRQTLARFERFIDERAHDRPNREGGATGYAFEPKDSEKRTRLFLASTLGIVVVAGIIAWALKPSSHRNKHGGVEKLRAGHHAESEAPAPLPAASPAQLVAAAELATPTKEAKEPAKAAEASPQPTKTPKTPVATPSPKPSATAPVASATPEAPAPAVTPSTPPSPDTPQVAGANPADPLDTGKDYKLTDLKEKVLIRTLAPIWVRYQVDGKPMRKFTMKKEGTLVLRGLRSIKLQVSNPKSATLSHNGSKSFLIEKVDGLRQANDTPSVVYPRKPSESIGEIFPGEGPLPQTPDPSIEAPAASPTPSAELSTPSSEVINTQ